jgi:hypothetical protein
MKTTMKTSTTNAEKWLRWISGGALVLALTSPLAPAPANAVINDDQVSETETVGHEVIPVEGTAPTPLPTAPWVPGGYTGGSTGSTGGTGGEVGGGGGISSEDADPSTSNSELVKERIAKERAFCEQEIVGTWTKNVIFHDKGIKANKQIVGYRCSSRTSVPGGLLYGWSFYDSRGIANYGCSSSATYTNCPDGHTGG